MAIIKLFSEDGLLTGSYITIEYGGTVGEFIAETYLQNDACSKPFQVFQGEPCAANEITKDFDRLINGNGEYVIIETPASGLEVATILAIVAVVISVAAVLLTPKPKLPDNINRQQQSPNNALGQRNNQPRPLQRIPDICGKLLSVPDIIQPPYYRYNSVFERLEYAYYCIGTGKIFVEAADVKDGDTPVQFIQRAAAGVYYPNKSPNNAAPGVQIGEPISTAIITAYRSNEVNGVDLIPFTESGLTPIEFNAGRQTFSGTAPYYGAFSFAIVPTWNTLNLTKSGTVLADWLSTDYQVGAVIEIQNGLYLVANDFESPTTSEVIDISGTYTITGIVPVSNFGVFYGLTLSPNFPQPINPLNDFSWGFDPFQVPQASIRTTSGAVIGQWYYMTKELFHSGWINIIAPNGLFRDTGAAAYLAITIDYEITVELLTPEELPTGVVQVIAASFTNNQNKSLGFTVDFTLQFPSKFRIKVIRTTGKFTGTGSFADRTQLLDVYGVVPVTATDFGDITTIQTLTIENTSAAAVKERRLNCQAVEGINRCLSAGVYEPTITPNIDANGNSSAVQSFIKLAKDPFIGGRLDSEIEIDVLLAIDNEIEAYFGDRNSNGFNYTFDSTDISFQEIAQTIFNSINCIAYRQGTQISALFEKPQPVPTMLFTHRSKAPDSEKYSRNFNQALISDGVEFNWVEPIGNTTETIILPPNAVNTRTYNIAGIRNEKQATIRAYRELNKLLHAKESCEITVTAEGRFIRPNDMVAIVKGTRVRTTDGEVIGQAGLVLTLSQPVAFSLIDIYSITLKNELGNIENIICTAGAADNQVILSQAPLQTIRTGIDARRTEFSFAANAQKSREYWLVQSIDNTEKWLVNLKAINYTELYYQNDNQKFKAFSNAFSNAFS